MHQGATHGRKLIDQNKEYDNEQTFNNWKNDYASIVLNAFCIGNM